MREGKQGSLIPALDEALKDRPGADMSTEVEPASYTRPIVITAKLIERDNKNIIVKLGHFDEERHMFKISKEALENFENKAKAYHANNATISLASDRQIHNEEDQPKELILRQHLKQVRTNSKIFEETFRLNKAGVYTSTIPTRRLFAVLRIMEKTFQNDINLKLMTELEKDMLVDSKEKSVQTI